MDQPNILLIVLDSVRAQNCSLYGHTNNTTPFLREFSERATVFEQARSPSIQSISSHASIFSGYHVEEHQMHDFESYLDPEENIWHELKEKYNYDTAMFSSNSIVTETSNLSSVFETVIGPKHTRSDLVVFENALSPKDFASTTVADFTKKAVFSETPIRSLINGMYYRFSSQEKGSYNPEKESASVYRKEFLNWLRGRNGPWAACMNLMDAHIPYVPEEEHDIWAGEPIKQIHDEIGILDGVSGRPWGQLRAIESLYDGCIKQLDSELRRLIHELEQMDELEETLLVITSDHGEGFGERSRLEPAIRMAGHNHGIHEVLTHVPLLVKEPHQETGESISEAASLTNFPKVVRRTLKNGDGAKMFLPDDEPVLSSNYRPVPEGFLPSKKPTSNLWRAVYKNEDGDLIKYATWGDRSAAVRVKNAQTAYSIDRDSCKIIDQTHGNISKENVQIGESEDRELDNDVKGRLEDLGYV